MTENRLDNNHNNTNYYAYCLTPDCHQKCKLTHKDSTQINCKSCGLTWCIRCGIEYHIGQSCHQFQQEIKDMEIAFKMQQEMDDMSIANNIQQQEDMLGEDQHIFFNDSNYMICVSCTHRHPIDRIFKWTKCLHPYCADCAYNIIIAYLCENNIPKCIKHKYGQQLLSLPDAQNILNSNELMIFQEVMAIRLHKQTVKKKTVEPYIDSKLDNDISISNMDELTLLIFGWMRLKVNIYELFVPKDITLICARYYFGKHLKSYIIKSNIINTTLRTELIDLLSKKNVFNNYSSTCRVYNGLLHGFDSKSLYGKMSKYNDDNPTILIVETANGSVFGVYMTIPWKLNGIDRDRNAFIFSLRTELTANANIFDIAQSHISYPKDHSEQLIYFGYPAALYLDNNCDESKCNYCDDTVTLCVLSDGMRKYSTYNTILHQFAVIDLEIHKFNK
eukprot:110282_1